ncbi:MAG: four helix bundle protein [Anaerolineales bacterium]|jgi:four helix bundle protein|nr:four helix bundle protein [Anaerolineales bacterium]MBX3006016.1 four helix bundle protein [Anaerolineales bacterium]
MNTDQNSQDLKKRTRAFAIQIIRMYSSLPKTTEAQVLGKQLLRAGTSVGAQYAEAQRAKSNKDFVTKIEGSLQELEEVLYWLDLLIEINPSSSETLAAVQKETNELLAIFVTIVKRVKSR